MRIIARRTLENFYEQHADARNELQAWWYEAKHAEWKSPADIKARYATASIIADNRVVFNIGGNKYRLVVKFHYNIGNGYIRFIGTHADYDKIDATTI